MTMSVHRSQHRKSYNEPWHAHELTFGCYRGYPFLARERVCQWLAEAIRQVRQELGMTVWAYVFMPNHVHLLVHFGCGEYDISHVLRQLKWPVSRKALAFLRANAPEWLPKLQTQRGQKAEFHFWQRSGGDDRNVTEPATLEKMIEYIHMNPVRKGLVDRATDWTWSSAQWYTNGTGPLEMDQLPLEWTVGTSAET